MKYRYDAFGNLFTQMAAPYNTVGYTGKSYDAKASLIDFSARWYSPNYGRFIQEDTVIGEIEFVQSLNRYAFAGNNSVNYIDPSGNYWWCYFDSGNQIYSHAPPCDNANNMVWIPDPDDGGSSGGDDGGSSGGGDDSGGGIYTPTIQEQILQRDLALTNNAGTITDDNESNLGKTLLTGAYNFLIGDDIASLRDGKLDFNDALAVVGFIPGVGKGINLGVKAAKVGVKATAKYGDDLLNAGKKLVNLFKKNKGVPGGTGQTYMFRKTTNTGVYSELTEPMQLKHVKNVANETGVGLDGIKIKIDRNPEMIGTGYTGHASGKTMTLYPDAFSSKENLVKTLGHERTHIYQESVFGSPNSMNLRNYELAAQKTEETWWKYFSKGGK